MSSVSIPLHDAKSFIPQQAPMVEHDHLWWINDAARMVRTEDWSELNPEHIRHLIEEVRDLNCLLDKGWVLNPPEPF
ncbi:MAG: hypothetical protein VBE63_25975 [Lamprobacter sp.]|uniref:hypothetical protein n=1 Tax=Lamprobacter sp. TaxID=3100796 RepID=UPI002B25E00A|nr:hypothetical protein [Lamprobacter sp.]MEA3643356.1 hypothetical protein [Lamprobacter sp.]